MKSLLARFAIILIILLSGCGIRKDVKELGPNGFLGSHKVTVSPGCVAATTHINQGASGEAIYETSCGSNRITIKNEELVVNGESFGELNKGDAIHVEDGKVFINSKPVEKKIR